MEHDYAIRYRQLYQQHWWWRSRESVILKCLRDYAGQRKDGDRNDLSILDIGCGDGLFFDRLSEFGTVRGVEIDERIVDPKGPHYDKILVGPFDESYTVDRPLSVVLMLDVLEHLPHPEDCLRHAMSLLSDDGIAIITVPAFNSLWTRHDEINQHYIRYEKSSFAKVATQSQMRIDRWEYFYHWVVAAKLAVRLKERLIPGAPKPASLPAAPINASLRMLCELERRLLGWMKLPMGTSLLVVGGKSNSSSDPAS